MKKYNNQICMQHQNCQIHQINQIHQIPGNFAFSAGYGLFFSCPQQLNR